jgi:hypothetical protein
LEITFPDEWCTALNTFAPKSDAYLTDNSRARGRTIHNVRISDIEPVRRRPLFRDNEEGCAAERVYRILQAFRLGQPIPPVEIIDSSQVGVHRYKLTHGVHRLYCSLAAGFSHVPAVEGFDINAPGG